MFTGNSDHNQLPHSSVLMRTEACRRAGNYNERAVGLGADDYQLWYRMHRSGALFVRDDDSRNIVYRIHEQNSLKIRKARYGASGSATPAGVSKAGRLITGAAAASLALFAVPALGSNDASKTSSAVEKDLGADVAPDPSRHITLPATEKESPGEPAKSKVKEEKKPGKATKPPHS